MEHLDTSQLAARLVVESGPLAGMQFSLNWPLMSIGRSPDNDIALDDEMASRNHCRILRQGASYLVEDTGSSNGTIINGVRESSRMLTDGDRLLIGQTTLVFNASDAAEGPGQPGRPRKKVALLAGALAGGLLLVAGVVILVVLVFLPEKDDIRPEVKFISPGNNYLVELHLPVQSAREVPLEILASDDKGLDKVEIMIDNHVLTTLKATSATREAKAEGPCKEEIFTYTWRVNESQNSTFKARAYDWKGNTSFSEPINIEVREGGDIGECRNYVHQIEPLIHEYSRDRSYFNQTYSGAKQGKLAWATATAQFYDVKGRREALLAKLGAMHAPPVFTAAHAYFMEAVRHAIKADELALLWAADMYAWDMYYGNNPYNPRNPPQDPMGFESQMLAASRQAQASQNAFNVEYDRGRIEQLNAGPGSHL